MFKEYINNRWLILTHAITILQINIQLLRRGAKPFDEDQPSIIRAAVTTNGHIKLTFTDRYVADSYRV